MQIDLTGAEFEQLRRAALRDGMTPEQYAEQAVTAAIKAKYVLPKSGGSVVPLRPKRSEP